MTLRVINIKAKIDIVENYNLGNKLEIIWNETQLWYEYFRVKYFKIF